MIRALILSALAALTLTACSMEAMSEKRVPPDVRAAVNAQIDQLIAGETQFIFDAFPDDQDNPDFRAQIEKMSANVPNGEELSRDVVGVIGSTEQAYSDTQGAVRRGTYNLAYELKFEDGYLLVQTAHTLDDTGQCCALRAINATRSDASPMSADQVGRAKLFKFLGLFFLITSLATAAFLIIRVGGKKARDKQMGDT
jgi:predicted RND superfamily exporter protein